MSSCGGVGGAGGSGNGGGNSVGGNDSVGGANASNSVGNDSSGGNRSDSVGTSESQNTTAEANNVDGANAKNGIDREAQTKADLNDKMDAATEQTAEQAQTEQTKAEQTKADQETDQAKADQAKADQAKADQAKAEQVATEKAKDQTLADKVVEAAKEVMAKAEEVAKTVKEEVGKAYEKAKEQIAAYEARQKELADLARQPEIRAMLDTIGFTEGTGLNYGKVVNGTVIGQNKKTMDYDTTLTPGMRNVTTLDMSQHPNVKVQVNKDIVSSAAGRYQFLSGTWNNVAQKLGLTNFHATSQDLAAVQLMRERNMIEPLLNGDLKTAVNRGAREWASLPKADGAGAYKGQNARSYEAIERAYNDFLDNARAMAEVNDFN